MLSHPGEGVVVQGPYYGSFAKIISLNGRRLLDNPLYEEPDQGYRMDLDHLERLFRTERPPLMILCNPHNPTGRCWSALELSELLRLCEEYDVILISDEICRFTASRGSIYFGLAFRGALAFARDIRHLRQ